MGVPRWVKVSGIIVAVVALLIVAMLLIAGGEHGPGRHSPPGDTGGNLPPPSVMDHTPPRRGHG